MANTVQLKKDGQIVYPVTDVSLIIGLQDAIKLPPIKTTTLPTASAETAGKMYYVGPDANDEYERYITSAVNGSYEWIDLGGTEIPLPSIADNLTTDDANTALSAKQGKVLNEEIGELEAEVDGILYDDAVRSNKVLFDNSTLMPGDSVTITLDKTYTGGGIALYDVDDNFLWSLYFTSVATQTISIPERFGSCKSIYYPSWDSCIIVGKTLVKKVEDCREDLVKKGVEITNIKGEILVSNYKNIVPQNVVENLRVAATMYAASGEILFYVPIKTGQTIHFDFAFTSGYARYGFSSAVPASNVSMSDVASKNTSGKFANITAQADGYASISFEKSGLQSITYAVPKEDVGEVAHGIKRDFYGVLYEGPQKASSFPLILFDSTQVKVGDTITMSVDKTYVSGQIVFYDTNDQSLWSTGFNAEKVKTGVIPNGFSYCKAASGPDWDYLLIKKASMENRVSELERKAAEPDPDHLLKGLKIAYNGDSICESRTNPEGSTYNGGAYAKMIADLVDGTYENRAVSGGILASVHPNNGNPARYVVSDVVNMAADADIVCFEGGINDYWANVPLGTFALNDYSGSYDDTTLCGALESIFYQAMGRWPGKPIVFVIVHKVGSTAYTNNSAGYSFQDAHDRMVEICAKWSIPVYDAFANSGLNGNVDAQNTAFFINNDRCHPNADGYKDYYVRQLVSLFSSLVPIE